MSEPRLLRWSRKPGTGVRAADWHGWHLTAWWERSGLGLWGRGWGLSRGGLTAEAEGSAPTFAQAQRAAEAALIERLTGHERAERNYSRGWPVMGAAGLALGWRCP